ncbi:MAG TPA: hypothetical protein VFB12_06085 [Ktedonobacteraceae bacterium]|nr:hypothetical protein [Ktedonobacteraceae bacterium]
MFSRIAPALLLFLLSPFVGELLLGDLSLSQLVAFPLLALLYGGGALFIRELTRRTGRGWPTILMLAIVYGTVEEAFVTQSLFNPNYLGLRLLDYGFLPSLGIGAFWTVYVLTLHVVWSISVPIALIEALFWSRRTMPWLNGFGFSVSIIVFALGALVGSLGTIYQSHFIASAGQFIVSAAIIVGLIIVAFAIFPKASTPSADQRARWGVDRTERKPPPRPWLLGALAWISGSAFFLLVAYRSFRGSPLPASIEVLFILVLEAIVIVLVIHASRSKEWSDAHRFALATGGLLVYCWEGFVTAARLHGVATFPVQAVWVVLAIVLLVFTGSRLRHRAVHVG